MNILRYCDVSNFIINMKPLKPSMKEHKRYLLIRGKNLKTQVEAAIRDFIGALGLSQSGLNFIKNNVISINRKMVDKVRASLALSESKIEVLKVSGTLKGLGK